MAVLHGRRLERARRRHLGRRARCDPRPRPPGGCPAATTRCGAWSIGAWPTRRPTRAPTVTAATPPRFRLQAPADLYSNSTIALHIDTGKLAWYYQHLPGDDWDEDYPHERTLTPCRRQPGSEVRQVDQPGRKPRRAARLALMVGEGGGVFALDRGTGQFLWASPFPFDTPELPDLEHRRQDRARGAEQERHVQRPAGP